MKNSSIGIPEYAKRLDQFINEFNQEKIILIGHSMGGLGIYFINIITITNVL